LTKEQPAHGPGQGIQQASALLLIISCILFISMFDHYHGASFWDPEYPMPNVSASSMHLGNMQPN
jgi:hypothetical protein